MKAEKEKEAPARTLTVAGDLYDRLEALREKAKLALKLADLSWNNFLHQVVSEMEAMDKKK